MTYDPAATMARVLKVYEGQRGCWLGVTAVSNASGVGISTVCKYVKRLATEGKLVHNGKRGPAGRYTLPPAPGDIVIDEQPRAKQKHRGAAAKLSDEERRRRDIEARVLTACADAPMRPRGVALSLVRNLLEVQGIMLDLCHRGQLRTRDGYRTFETVRSV